MYILQRAALVFILGIVLVSGSGNARDTFTLQGYITDTTSNPLEGVNVYLINTYTGATTDSIGWFSLSMPGLYGTLVIRSIGYNRRNIQLKNLRDKEDTLHVILRPTPINGAAVTVYEKPSGMENSLSLKMLTRRSIRNVPALGEVDVNRALALLPGVDQLNEYRSSLNVRGGQSDQNLFLIDGMELLYAHHLFGVFSAVNQYILNEVNFYPGYRPMRYGDRVGAVLDIHTPSFRATNKQNYLNLSLLAASGTYHHKWNNIALLLSGRRTHFEFLYPFYGFYDYFGKLMWIASPTLLFSISVYDQKDYFRTPKEDRETGYTPFWNTRIFSKWGDRIYTFRAAKQLPMGEWISDIGYSQALINFPDVLDNQIRTMQIQSRLRNTKGAMNWETGLQINRRSFGYNWTGVHTSIKESLQPAIHPSYDVTQLNNRYTKSAAFLDIAYSFNRKVSLRSGIRLTSIKEHTNLSPAFQWKYTISPLWTLEIGYYQGFQYLFNLQEAHELQLTGLIIPVDTPIHSDNYTINHLFTLPRGMRFLWETYYREIRKVPSFDRFTQITTYQTYHILGSDVLFTKDNGYLNWQLGVSFLRVLEIHDGVKNLGDHDIPVSLKGNVRMEIGNKWYFNLAGLYRTGRPYTSAYRKFMGGNYQWEIIPSRLPNTDRLPDYYRFDISFRKKLVSKKGGEYTISIQVLNITSHRNILRREQSASDQQADNVLTGMPILPSIGVEYAF